MLWVLFKIMRCVDLIFLILKNNKKRNHLSKYVESNFVILMVLKIIFFKTYEYFEIFPKSTVKSIQYTRNSFSKKIIFHIVTFDSSKSEIQKLH